MWKKGGRLYGVRGAKGAGERQTGAAGDIDPSLASQLLWQRRGRAYLLPMSTMWCGLANIQRMQCGVCGCACEREGRDGGGGSVRCLCHTTSG